MKRFFFPEIRKTITYIMLEYQPTHQPWTTEVNRGILTKGFPRPSIRWNDELNSDDDGNLTCYLKTITKPETLKHETVSATQWKAFF